MSLPLQTANRSEAYCDFIGCHVPKRIGLVSFSLLRMGWSTSAHAWLGPRNAKRRRWCGAQELFLDPDMLESPETWRQAVEPLRRVSLAGPGSAFSVDHRVFGNYGSLWNFFTLATGRWISPWGLACTGACLEAVLALRRLAEVDDWWQLSLTRRQSELQGMLKQGPFSSLRHWAARHLSEEQDLQSGREAVGMPPRAKTGWRLCGPLGMLRRPMGRLSATVLGVWAQEHLGHWEVELSVFVAPREDCVLVDGNRLFQTHPQSYLTQWACSLDGSRSTSQGVVSYSGTVTLIRCRFPSAPSSTAELAVFSTLEHLQEAGWSITGLRLCPFQPLRPVSGMQPYARRLVVCSEVLYGLRGAYKSALVKHWLEYHRLIGVDHFVLYDRDGSLAEDGVLEPYLLNGYVTYVPRFSLELSARHDAVHALPGLPSHAAADAQAASHCLFAQRGLSEWVAFLHSPDEYLSSQQGLRHVEEVLRVLRPMRDQGLAAVDVSAIYFTRSQHRKPQGPVRASPWLFGRYVYRASKPLMLKNWGSPVAGFLNRFGSPLVVPERVGDLVSAHYPRPNAGTSYLDDVPMDFLRANHYGEAFHVRQIIEEHDVPVKDESLLWAEEAMSRLDLEPLPPAPEP